MSKQNNLARHYQGNFVIAGDVTWSPHYSYLPTLLGWVGRRRGKWSREYSIVRRIWGSQVMGWAGTLQTTLAGTRYLSKQAAQSATLGLLSGVNNDHLTTFIERMSFLKPNWSETLTTFGHIMLPFSSWITKSYTLTHSQEFQW